MSEKVLGFKEKNSCYNKDAWLCGNCGLLHTDTVGECCEGIRKRHLVPVRLASESVDLKEHKIVLEENRILKQALKYVCSQNNITYDSFWKRIKPDKWRDYIAKIIKTE